MNWAPWVGLLLALAGCADEGGRSLAAEPSDAGALCETRSLSSPTTITSTSGAALSYPRFDPSTGRVAALLVVGLTPKDVVFVDANSGQTTGSLGLGADLRTIPTDFSLTHHAPFILFSGRAGLSMRTLTNGEVRVLLPGRLVIEPELSPDGRRLVFRENTRLYELSLSDSGVPMGEPEELVLTQGVGAMRPRFSPTGGEIAYFMDGVVEIYDFATRQRRVLRSALGQAHVAWLEDERIVVGDDQGVAIMRGDCLEAQLDAPPARHVDAHRSSGAIVFSSPGDPSILLVRGALP